MTEQRATDEHHPPADRQRRTTERRRRYLPSDQVLEELAAIPDLTGLARELRERLTDLR